MTKLGQWTCGIVLAWLAGCGNATVETPTEVQSADIVPTPDWAQETEPARVAWNHKVQPIPETDTAAPEDDNTTPAPLPFPEE